MQSGNFLHIAKKIAKKDAVLFETLMEFEKTKKIRTKTTLNFTIDKTVASNFKKFCRNHGYNMSAKVEQAMSKLIDESK